MNGARKNQNAREASPKTHIQTSQASRGTRPASYVRTRRTAARRSANSWHGPNTSPHAHRRRPSTLPRERRRASPVAEVSGAHRAGAGAAGDRNPSLT